MPNYYCGADTCSTPTTASSDSAREIWDNEISVLAPQMCGIKYERLQGDGLQWPCPTEEEAMFRGIGAKVLVMGIVLLLLSRGGIQANGMRKCCRDLKLYFQRLAQLDGQLIHRKWLLDKIHAFVQDAFVGDDVGRISGHE